MKKIILLALTALMMVGCGMKKNEKGEIIVSDYYNQHSIHNPYITVLDSCEYICWESRMAHKGNCKFCKERRQKELKYIIEQIKEK